MTIAFQSALGATIRHARKKRHLTLKDVAGRTSGQIGTAQLSSYERGDRNINVENLSMLARLYQVEVHTLIPNMIMSKRTTLTIHQERLEELPPEVGGPFARWVRASNVTRETVGRQLIPIHVTHLEHLAVLHGMAPDLFIRHFSALGVLS